jgi:hypothetical protein
MPLTARPCRSELVRLRLTNDGKRRFDGGQLGEAMRQVGLVEVAQFEGQPIAYAWLIRHFAGHVQTSIRHALDGQVDPVLHAQEDRGTEEVVVDEPQLLGEAVKLVRPQIGGDVCGETAYTDTDLRSDPIAIPVIRRAWMRASEHPNDDMIGTIGTEDQGVLHDRDPVSARAMKRPLMPLTVRGRADGRTAAISVDYMTAREVDEHLAMLCHTELAGGGESLAGVVGDLPRPELERLLCLAVVELMDSQHDAEKQIARMARRLQEHRAKAQD